MDDEVDVAIVGGGPAGAATAIHVARRGYRVAICERHAASRWRACGVFASPLARERLADLGFTRTEIRALHEPISTMLLQSTSGVSCALEYKHGLACGFDRVRLDAALLEHAAREGAEVRPGTVVRDVDLEGYGRGELTVSSLQDESPRRMRARIVVGADGGASRVARAASVAKDATWLRRAGITFHVRNDDVSDDQLGRGRFLFGAGWYVGIAPVPAARRNVGIVVPADRLKAGVRAAIDGTVGAATDPLDEPQVAGHLEHHVVRVTGNGWLLVGDSTGFVDPLTGEGLHRAFVTAQLAAETIDRSLSGDRKAMAVYDRRVRSRFRSKNVFSLVLQAFIADPRVRDYALRRLDRRPSLRDELTSVLADQARASRALDPRFLSRLLAP